MKTKRGKGSMWMWLVLALVAIVAILLVDPARYSSKVPTDQEIDRAGESIGENASIVDGDIEVEVQEFAE